MFDGSVDTPFVLSVRTVSGTGYLIHRHGAWHARSGALPTPGGSATRSLPARSLVALSGHYSPLMSRVSSIGRANPSRATASIALPTCAVVVTRAHMMRPRSLLSVPVPET